MKKILCALLLSLCSLAAISATNNLVDVPFTATNGSKASYDASTIKYDPITGIVKVLVIVTYPTAQTAQTDKKIPVVYNMLTFTGFFDCKKHMLMSMNNVVYSGIVAVMKDDTVYPWTPVLPSSFGEAEMQTVCAQVGAAT